LSDIKSNKFNIDEYKDLINLEKWDEIFQSGDGERINEEMDSLKFAMEEMKGIVNLLNTK
jgi:hypothetical protein